MSVTLEDLQPKPININLRGVELVSKPLRLKHALILAKVGKVLEGSSESTTEEITQAQTDIDAVLVELIPELKDIELDMNDTMAIITELMGNIQPDDNKELSESKVSFNTDPKAQTTG